MAATASPLCSRNVLSATFLSISSSLAMISTSSALIFTAASSFSRSRCAFRSASDVAAMDAIACCTRVESSCRSSTWSVSESSALLCCCKSLESGFATSTPSSAIAAPSRNTASNSLKFPANELKFHQALRSTSPQTTPCRIRNPVLPRKSPLRSLPLSLSRSASRNPIRTKIRVCSRRRDVHICDTVHKPGTI
ncbi:hypothetical protein M758_7G141400 [Ceratodon purpureus]|uniref:Uncharacterized protein n=1 Tax=Ceratodon purpureus TaxID=3225 RepID=A0A8T0HAR1_CERPU|nr:hypothetical protein KC19_7G136900 [Ceratodon purpureus]KAG0611442.1 hypothetical protein M758_7G141400 [Ceratodon purpureus]